MAEGIDTLSRMDLSDLLFSPFNAAAMAQAKLANITVDFIKTFAFETAQDPDFPDDPTKQIQTNDIRTVTVSSYFEMPLDASGQGELIDTGIVNVGATGTADDPDIANRPTIFKRQGTRQLTIPFLSLLNVPALQMQKVTVDLTVKIESQTKATTNTSATSSVDSSTKASMSFSSWFSPVSASISTSVNTKATNSNNSTNSVDNSSSSKLDIHMEAINQPPVGLTIILDFLTSKSDMAPKRVANYGTATGSGDASTRPMPTL
jgi:hypothetical protein